MKSIPEISKETQTLIGILSTMKKGEVIAYDSLTKSIGRDIKKAWGCLSTARKNVLKQSGIVVECVFGQGVKRLDDNEIVKACSSVPRKLGRIARRANKKVLAADYDKLTNNERLSANTSLTLLAFVEQATKHNSVKKIESAINVTGRKLELSDTLKVFSV